MLTPTKAVHVRGLTIALPNGRLLVDGAHFDVDFGQVVSLLGASGAGKTTLLNALLSPEKSRSEGLRVQWVARAVSEPHAVVPQRGALLDYLDVRSNVALAQAANALATEPEIWLRAVGLNEGAMLPGRGVESLSGGEAQRVAVARALAADRKVIVLDEPSIGLDVASVRTLARLLEKQTREQRVAIVVVTHDLTPAGGASDRIVFLDPERRCLVEVPWSGPAEAEEPADRHGRLTKLETRIEYLMVASRTRGQVDSRGSNNAAAPLAPWRMVRDTFAAPLRTAGSAVSRAWSPKLRPESGVVFRRTLRESLIRPAFFYGTVGGLLGFTVPFVIANISPDLRAAAVFELIKGTYISALAPPISAIVFAATSGSGVNAWLGGLSLQGQVTALRGIGVSPQRYLWAPTWLALVFAYLAAFVVFTVAMVFGGWVLYSSEHVGHALGLLTADFVEPPAQSVPVPRARTVVRGGVRLDDRVDCRREGTRAKDAGRRCYIRYDLLRDANHPGCRRDGAADHSSAARRWILVRFSTLAGSALFATLFAALPGLLAPGASKSDLVATARSRYGLGPVTTPGLRTSTPGTTIEQIYTDGEPGLHWTIARKTYGDAYLREVAWPALAGPMRNESDFVCGYDLYLGGNLFDTSGAGIGLQKALRDSLTSVFPSIREVEGIRFALPALDTVEFIVTPQEGYVDLYLRVRLVDATELGVSLPVRLVTRHGAPAVQRMPERPIATSFEGPTKDLILRKAREYGGSGGAVVGLSGCAFGPLGCLLGILFGGQVGGSSGENQAAARIQEEIISGIDRELRALSLGLSHSLGPFHPMSSRPGDTLELRLEGDPIVRPNGISLPLCVQMTTSPPKVDTAISGPTACGSERLQHRDSGSSAPIIGLTLNADAVNQLAHYLWQSGLLRQVGESSVVVDGLSKEVRMAAFDFTGFDPGLPPTLSTRAANPGIPFDLGNVALGSLGPRTVMAHGQATLSVIQDDDSIALHGALGDIWVNCIEPSEAGIDLTPCLSDLVPLMRTLARDATAPKTLFRMARGDILGQLPQLGFFGMRLALSDLQIRTEGTPIRLELRVTAQTQ